ncbi:MAG: MerR family transcriptional regulator [Clostridia bacterium]|nr:MerR family transcriptional regulator [Clostridia bacterium]
MKDKFLIGELARLFNISTDTLRHYDKMNLLKPEYDTINNYRYYDIRSVFKLSRILFLKNLEIPLGEIENYMQNKNADRLSHMLKKKSDALDFKIQQLTNLKHKIHTKLDLLDHAKTKLGKIYVSEIDYRYGIFLKTLGLSNDYEIKQAFKKHQHFLKMSSWLVEGQIYTSITKPDMEAGIFNQFQYFIAIDPLDNVFQEELEIFPKSQYACMTVIGPYEDLIKHYRILVDWIDENGYEIAGDSIENNIVDYDYADSADEYITELQIPIRKANIL